VSTVVDPVLSRSRFPIMPFGRLVRRSKEDGRPDLESLSVFLGQGVVPRSSRDDNHNRLGADLCKYLVVRPDDLVFNKLRTWQGGFGRSRYEGIVSPAYFVCRPKPDVDSRYLHFLLLCAPYMAELTRVSKFMPPSQFDIMWDDLKLLPIPVPPLATQRAIADYLDTETARIDALIEKKRRMVELLESHLRSFISEATSDGPFVQIRRVTSMRTSGPRGWGDRVGDVGQPFIRSANLQRNGVTIRTDNLAYVDVPASPESQRSTTREGDVLIGITGANTGWVGHVEAQLAGGFVSQHVAILRPDSVNSKWLAYTIYSFRSQDQLLGGQYGGTKQQLGLDDLADLRVSAPSLQVQQERVKTLDMEWSKVERLLVWLGYQIDLLIEHRQAVITAAVTGELTIPAVAA